MKKIQFFLVLIILSIIYLSLSVNSAFVIKDSSELINAYKNHNLVRLHVIANSNSPEDQYLKREVRNNVINYMAVQLENNDNYKNGLSQRYKNDIKKVINNVLKKNNVNYSAKILFGNYNFPRRTYKDYTLPPGRYKAMKIILGKGQGSNWWCVLLPPLCLENNIGKISNSDLKVEFRLKLAEIFNIIKNKDKKFITKYSEIKIFKSDVDELKTRDLKSVINY